jgi:Fic family protein
MNPIEEAISLKQTLDQLRPISPELERLVMDKFRLDWNYHSNHIEGNSLSYGETKALLLFGITAQGKPLKDHIEITGHNEAVNWIIDIVKGDVPLTENFIRELHSLLLKESYEVDAITPEGLPTKKRIEIGQYKTSANHVKTKIGEIFRFATPEETPAKMNDLIDWFRDKKQESDVNPIILAVEFHYKFILIHPFDDGNGRTARIVMNFILMQFGYPPVIIKTEDKEQYFAALRQADAGVLEPFIMFITQNLVHSLNIMISGAKGESIAEENDLDKELVLLEQRFKIVNNKTKTSKSIDSITESYNNSILRLVEAFNNSNERLAKFYLSNSSLAYKNHEVESKHGANYAHHLISNDLFSLLFNFEFKGLNHIGLKDGNYTTSLDVNFTLEGYLIEVNGNKKISKNYQQQLSDLEIHKIVNEETLNHKNFIEQKLKEIENK